MDTGAAAEDVQEDQLCPICHLLLFQPVITACAHTTCGVCMAQWADTSATTHMTVVDLDEEFTESFPGTLEANCPMCRSRTVALPNDTLARSLEAAYPATYAERRTEEEAARDAKLKRGASDSVSVFVGNKHRLVRPRTPESSLQHDWTFFVEVSKPDIVKEVKIYLHPTFRPPLVTIRDPPFAIRRLGWGYFTITANVILKEGWHWVHEDARPTTASGRRDTLPLDWTLDFDGRGSKGRWMLKYGRCGVEEQDNCSWY